MRSLIIRSALIMLSVFTTSFNGCKSKDTKQQKKVVIYTSLDKVFSQPILEAFEKKTGIKVKAVYDSEATKTTGLVNRLIAEKNAPQADVFWNSETSRTIVLKKKGVLARYVSPLAADIPATFKIRALKIASAACAQGAHLSAVALHSLKPWRKRKRRRTKKNYESSVNPCKSVSKNLKNPLRNLRNQRLKNSNIFKNFQTFSIVFERFCLARLAQPLYLNTPMPIFTPKTHIHPQN